jgi:hypothetical protein
MCKKLLLYFRFLCHPKSTDNVLGQYTNNDDDDDDDDDDSSSSSSSI